MAGKHGPHGHGHGAHDPEASGGYRVGDKLSDGKELHLDPVFALDLARVTSFSDLLSEMAHTSFGGRTLGEAADVLYEMAIDPDVMIVGTFSGAMTVAKMGLLICDMIDEGMLDVVISTGALMTHGLVEAAGMTHFKVPPDMDDRQMFYAGLDRVYDTLELEKNLNDLSDVVQLVMKDWPDGMTASSHTICERMGHWLTKNMPGRGILPSAVAKGVPVFVPAFTDSELGLDIAILNRIREKNGQKRIAFDPYLDLEAYTAKVASCKKMGIFTIGGGVPRNWAQQVGPYLDLLGIRAGIEMPLRRFEYGVRICPEPVHWGGLSGCTYSEGVSWGKFVPVKDGGRYAEVPSDATIAWPILLAGVMERVRAHRAKQPEKP
jgi:deoxyhypusine synthase